MSGGKNRDSMNWGSFLSPGKARGAGGDDATRFKKHDLDLGLIEEGRI